MEFDDSRNGKSDGDTATILPYSDPRNSLEQSCRGGVVAGGGGGVKLKAKRANKLLFSPAGVVVPGYSTVEPS